MSDPFTKEKLYEALDYFSRNVKHAGKVKLFKLLYFLDLMVLRRTGKSVTGLRYEAWPMGPVPAELEREFQDPSSELHQRFEVKLHQRIESDLAVSLDTDEAELEAFRSTVQYIPGSIRGHMPYRHRFLTRREQGLAERLAEIFRDANAEAMSDVSHGKMGPWQKAIFRGRREHIERPEINLLEGVVACGDATEELPPEELKELIKERERLRQVLG